jgi:ferritin-like metal-binding protein YciE
VTALRSAQDILVTELKEIYSAERQLSRAIPKLTKRVTSDRLREKLEQRREQGVALLEELDAAFEDMEVSKSRLKNVAAEGLLEDVNGHLDEIEDEKLLDPVLLASVQKIEHYCIAAWGTAASMARLLDEADVTKTMERVLGEGKRFDEELTSLAESEVNPAMLAEDRESEEDEGSEDKQQAKSAKSGGRRKSH